MSYTHTKRRKLIKALKKEFPKNWYKVFRSKVETDIKERQGQGISLQELIDTNQIGYPLP